MFGTIKKPESRYFCIKEKDMVSKLAAAIKEMVASVNKPVKIVCIGTDRSTGDSLGPLVGYKLQGKGMNVAGTLDEPLHGQNIREYAESKGNLEDFFVIAVDACLGRAESVGKIVVKQGPLYPGSGVNKDLPGVGDMNIQGIVNVGGFMEYMVLANTRLSEVMKQADFISMALELAVVKEEAHNVQ